MRIHVHSMAMHARVIVTGQRPHEIIETFDVPRDRAVLDREISTPAPRATSVPSTSGDQPRRLMSTQEAAEYCLYQGTVGIRVAKQRKRIAPAARAEDGSDLWDPAHLDPIRARALKRAQRRSEVTAADAEQGSKDTEQDADEAGVETEARLCNGIGTPMDLAGLATSEDRDNSGEALLPPHGVDAVTEARDDGEPGASATGDDGAAKDEQVERPLPAEEIAASPRPHPLPAIEVIRTWWVGVASRFPRLR